MGCGCGKNRAGRGGQSDTIGFYVVTPSGQVLPAGVDPENPEKGSPPFLMYAEAHSEVIGVGGTIHRLKRKRTA